MQRQLAIQTLQAGCADAPSPTKSLLGEPPIIPHHWPPKPQIKAA